MSNPHQTRTGVGNGPKRSPLGGNAQTRGGPEYPLGAGITGGEGKADERTRTADPFITSEAVRPVHRASGLRIEARPGQPTTTEPPLCGAMGEGERGGRGCSTALLPLSLRPMRESVVHGGCTAGALLHCCGRSRRSRRYDSGMAQRGTGHHSYRRLRAAFLAEHQVCAWCRRAPAETVDHLVPMDAGADRNDVSNWVPACRSCNSRRGAHYGNAKRRRAAADAEARRIRRPVVTGAN